ncbi:hypothetical protein GOODEAATRI_018021 [Goodea atripinnis]|uniref:Uncharacterized protein n=1 Tax=Goodea atripinnis TaxID=208336 RepID=A0ABV0MT66_9TELE
MCSGNNRNSDDLDPNLAQLGSLGFTGCLSVVRFNSISPLKAALLYPDTSPVVVFGPLVPSNCGSSASANPYSAENTHHLSGKRFSGCQAKDLQHFPSFYRTEISSSRSAGHIQPRMHFYPS